MAAWKNWLHHSNFEWHFHPTAAGVETARRQLLEALDDCQGFECDRLRWRLHTAERAQELWLLRESVFQVVAGQHCQAQAAERINRLVPAFQTVLPPGVVTRV
ncbi:hypothetical protein [Ramlibacter pallidus]|uniref:Uncharacterized protein n=1 Tax=Ramlibacter pallidus TaxID=2780087 RepID=A0ABR9RYX5_9BURK|nr:hypothetical protein [Ramlibacter pallidus]MBE7366456.1 hypothetical protein [Ramlibacter pallidus]